MILSSWISYYLIWEFILDKFLILCYIKYMKNNEEQRSYALSAAWVFKAQGDLQKGIDVWDFLKEQAQYSPTKIWAQFVLNASNHQRRLFLKEWENE